MIVSANLDNRTTKLFKKINKIRKYGWFSNDVRQMLIKKYGEEKKLLIEELTELTKERNKYDDKIKEIAKKINKLK